MTTLQNSFGPEATPYEAINRTPPEFDATGRIMEKNNGAPEVLTPSLPEKDGDATGSRPRKVCGIKVALFWSLLVGLVIAIAVGVGVGVGVGMKKSNSNTSDSGKDSASQPSSPSSSPPPPPASSTTSSAPARITSGTHGLAANSCNTTTPRTGHVSGTTFTEFCYVDWPNGTASWNGDARKVVDLDRTVVYSFEDCMAACVDYNDQKPPPKTRCWAVTYVSNLTDIIEVRGSVGNCFLKDRRGVDSQGSAESASAAIVAK